ncbi:C2 domain protein [Dictyocaulus viviparus]|uniref:Copine-3 n=1 Tax=Dictyocaulus viviparus TaxID=29172 RepID=A0A0D8XM74_DICVI|nr:C2 domain protein [Dictyocaulus viviparus]
MFDADEEVFSTPSVIILLTLKASELRDKDVFSKSDPMCVVSQFVGRLSGEGRWVECGRTEKLQNTLNPEWATQMRIQYFFEEKQTMKFEIYDIDSSSTDLSAHDFLGRVECDLAEIVSNRPFRRPLSGLKGYCGELTVWSDEIDEGSKESVQFHISARKLEKKSFFGKLDPFMKVYRINGDGTRLLAYRTEAIKKQLNPVWKPFIVNVQLLCNGDRTKPIVFECFDYHRNGSHSLVGNCQMNLDELLSKEIKSKPLINERKREKKGNRYKNSGTLEIEDVQLLKNYTFLDYIAGGTQLGFAVAVDFTASNGAVHKPTSLHYINPTQPNQYEIAIRAVIDICQHYNNSKLFDAFGFGAILPPETCVSPIFSLNFDANPTVVGLSGVLEAYRFALNRVKLYGPTNFAPVINEVAKKASSLPNDGSRYQVLLIITDGAINDMNATKSSIISASSLPLSIIIVGVGNEDFGNMKELDSDDRALSYGGHTASRDIVQQYIIIIAHNKPLYIR